MDIDFSSIVLLLLLLVDLFSEGNFGSFYSLAGGKWKLVALLVLIGLFVGNLSVGLGLII